MHALLPETIRAALEREEYKRVLRRSEERHQTIFDTVPSAFGDAPIKRGNSGSVRARARLFDEIEG